MSTAKSFFEGRLFVICRLCVSFAIGFVTMAGETEAASYAVLVGISEYQHFPTLEGPAYDLPAMEQTLVKHYGFSEDHVQLLPDKNKKATRANILAALEQLSRTAKAGDQVVFYFSGHGLSVAAPGAQALPYRSGAIVPYDGRDPNLANDQGDSLIVGKRDLNGTADHPGVLRRLDDMGVQTLVIFDSCYSGEAVKSWPMLPKSAQKSSPRIASIRSPVLQGPPSAHPFFQETEDSSDDDYPYHHVLFLAASQLGQTAKDINTEQLSHHPTFDGKPHGAYTEALLKALLSPLLAGSANQVPVTALFERSKSLLMADFPDQTPQLLPRPGMAAWDQASRMRLTQTSTSVPPPSAEPLRVELEAGVPPAWRTAIQGLDEVILVGANPDVVVAAANGQAHVVFGNNKPIWTTSTLLERLRNAVRTQGWIKRLQLIWAAVTDNPAEGLREVVRTQAWIKRLRLNAGLGDQSLPRIEACPSSTQCQDDLEQAFLADRNYAIRVSATQEVHLLLVSVNPEGRAWLFNPQLESPIRKLELNADVSCDPCGSEILLAAALRANSADVDRLGKLYNRYKVDGIAPGSDDHAALVKVLEQANAAGNMAMLSVTTFAASK